jgi:TolA-binding protein
MKRTALAVLCLPLLGGCWTSRADGEALRRDVDALKRQTSSDIRKAEEERVKLQRVLEQATGLLTRNSADVGVQVERLQAKVDKLSGELDERQRKVTELAQKLADYQAKIDVKLEGLSRDSAQNKDPPVPADKDELYRQASAKLTAGDHQEARRLLRHFITRFPTDARMDRAQLMLGDSYYAEQKFAPAIVEYKKIIEQYQQSVVVPDALAKIGMSFYQLKFCADAQLFFSQLLKKHKKHPQAATATKILGLIKRYKNNREFCRP